MISEKNLNAFKEQIAFENHPEYVTLMDSQQMSEEQKDSLFNAMSEYRERMINDYRAFMQKHYGKIANIEKNKKNK